jgi:four helix bundle suffix protein
MSVEELLRDEQLHVLEKRFFQEGGFTERMYKVRSVQRGKKD